MKNQLIFFKRLIYALQKDYGFKLDLYRPVETFNPRTGKKITVRTKYKIRKAILFPSDMFRNYTYLSLIKTLMPQSFDGLFDVTNRRIMISKKSLPKDFVIDLQDYIVFNHGRYGIKNVDEMELVDYWQLIISKITGEPTYEVNEATIRDELVLVESINDVVLSDAVPERLAVTKPI